MNDKRRENRGHGGNLQFENDFVILSTTSYDLMQPAAKIVGNCSAPPQWVYINIRILLCYMIVKGKADINARYTRV